MGNSRKEILGRINALANQPVTYEMLKDIYQATVDIANNDVSWYQTRQRRWRFATRVVKVLTYIGLAVGMIIPLLPDNNAILHYGYVSLVIAGLIFSLDRIFLFSKSWIRYINAEMEIRQLLLRFHYQWYQDRLALGDNVSREQGREILGKFKAFIEAVHQVIRQETAKWAEEIENSVTELGNQLKSKMQDVETKIKESEAQARQANSGALQLTVTNAENDEEITISIDDKQVVSGKPQGVYSFTALPAGIHSVKVMQKQKGDAFSVNTYTVKINAGEITIL